MRRASLILAALVAAGPVLAQTFSDTGPDAEAYGARDNYPASGPGVWRDPKYLVGRFSRNEERARTRRIERGDAVWAFKRAAEPIELDYKFRGQPRSLALYLANHPTTGLLVLKDDTILYEAYQYARTDKTRFVSQSMGKTFTSMLVGIAVAEGRIASIDDPVEKYVQDLRGKEYGRTPIRGLLHMSSGVAFREDYGGDDDINRMWEGLRKVSVGGQGAVLGQFNHRAAPPLTEFHYASIETEILGLVVKSVIDKPLAEYLSEKVWRRIGVESDAKWDLDGGGGELTYCCINATLRDYARFGRLLAHDGNWNGEQIIPKQWVIDATTPPVDKPYLAPRSDRYGYGYQVWLVPPPPDQPARRIFALLGIHGQTIFVDPESKLVLVQTAVRKLPSNDPQTPETGALWRALLAKFGQK